MKKHDVEARLDRSLASQVRVPKLDRRFDAAVWARIEAEERAQRPAVVPVRAPASEAQRWLLASNLGGFIVAAILVVYFGVRMLGGAAVAMPAMPLPSLSPEQTAAAMKLVVWGFTIGALAFGVMFTPLGRRLRSEFT
jgi:hypothetical protein